VARALAPARRARAAPRPADARPAVPQASSLAPDDGSYAPPPSYPPTAPTAAPGDTSVSEKAAAVFRSAWARLEARLGDRLAAPREIVYLMGAPGEGGGWGETGERGEEVPAAPPDPPAPPGSGKSANRQWILDTRGLTRCITMSGLLASNPAIVRLMAAGDLVPDALVCDALLAAVCDPDADPAGLLVDGFPRTGLQTELLKALHDKLAALHAASADTASEWRFPRPSFKVVVLYVDQDISIARQLSRARTAATHNARVLDAGVGELHAVRPTDVDAKLCARRYSIYRQHFNTICRLKSETRDERGRGGPARAPPQPARPRPRPATRPHRPPARQLPRGHRAAL